ncbi:MAG: DUF1778 domain-containing protein [Acidobacteriota bacterium]
MAKSASRRSQRSARIDLRLSPQVRGEIERAADISGLTLSAFMLAHARDAARRVLSEHEAIVLSDRDRDIFLRAIENPPEPNKALRRLLRGVRAR